MGIVLWDCVNSLVSGWGWCSRKFCMLFMFRCISFSSIFGVFMYLVIVVRFSVWVMLMKLCIVIWLSGLVISVCMNWLLILSRFIGSVLR